MLYYFLLVINLRQSFPTIIDVSGVHQRAPCLYVLNRAVTLRKFSALCEMVKKSVIFVLFSPSISGIHLSEYSTSTGYSRSEFHIVSHCFAISFLFSRIRERSLSNAANL